MSYLILQRTLVNVSFLLHHYDPLPLQTAASNDGCTHTLSFVLWSFSCSVVTLNCSTKQILRTLHKINDSTSLPCWSCKNRNKYTVAFYCPKIVLHLLKWSNRPSRRACWWWGGISSCELSQLLTLILLILFTLVMSLLLLLLLLLLLFVAVLDLWDFCWVAFISSPNTACSQTMVDYSHRWMMLIMIKKKFSFTC